MNSKIIKLYKGIQEILNELSESPVELIITGSLAMEMHGLPYKSEKQDLDMIIYMPVKSQHTGELSKLIEETFNSKPSQFDYPDEEIGERFFMSFPEGEDTIEAQIFMTPNLFHDQVFKTVVDGVEVLVVSPRQVIEAKHHMGRDKDVRQLKEISDFVRSGPEMPFITDENTNFQLPTEDDLPF